MEPLSQSSKVEGRQLFFFSRNSFQDAYHSHKFHFSTVDSVLDFQHHKIKPKSTKGDQFCFNFQCLTQKKCLSLHWESEVFLSVLKARPMMLLNSSFSCFYLPGESKNCCKLSFTLFLSSAYQTAYGEIPYISTPQQNSNRCIKKPVQQ